MAADPDPKRPAPPLLARWRATAPGATPPPPPPREALAPPRVSVVDLLREFDEAVRAALPPAQARAAAVLMDPIGRAAGVADAERDPAALAAAFDKVEDLLESLLLTRPSSPVGE